jgi:hypothetical protein
VVQYPHRMHKALDSTLNVPHVKKENCREKCSETILYKTIGVGEMLQQFRTLVAFPEAPGLILSTSRQLKTICNFNSRVLGIRQSCITQIHMQSKHPYSYFCGIISELDLWTPQLGTHMCSPSPIMYPHTHESFFNFNFLLVILFTCISNVIPFPSFPPQTSYPLTNPSCFYEGAPPPTYPLQHSHPLPTHHPSIPLCWGIKTSQDQGLPLPLMPDKAILCYIYNRSHGSLHVCFLVGALVPGSSGGSGWLILLFFLWDCKPFRFFSPFSSFSIGNPVLLQVVITIVSRFGDCSWDGSPSGAVSGWPFWGSIPYAGHPETYMNLNSILLKKDKYKTKLKLKTGKKIHCSTNIVQS